MSCETSCLVANGTNGEKQIYSGGSNPFYQHYMSLPKDYLFLENKISVDSIGEHDADNRFMIEDCVHQMDAWKEDHPGCTMIGVFYADEHPNCRGFYPFVYEDENGDRFWTHWDLLTIQEYIENGLL